MKLISCNSKRKTMGKTHKKTDRRQGGIKRARHSDRRMKIGAIVICATIAIITFVVVGMQLLVPVTEAAVSADNKTRSGNVDVQKNNNSLTASKMDSGKKQNSSEADVNAAEQSSEPDKETKLDEILQSANYPVQLKELAKKNDEAIDFIYEYPEEHSKKHDIDLTAEASQDTVPLLQQWDKRWGYEKYSGNYFAASGCGPTALSMVVLYLTHDAQASPLAVAEYAKEAGYSVDGSGSAWDLMSKGCRHYGVNAKTIKEDEDTFKERLDEGNLIVVNVGPGDFTDNGHFMVITGYDDEGFTINDPNSIIKSNTHWQFERLSSQIRAAWRMFV
jgi:hypothetical protein